MKVTIHISHDGSNDLSKLQASAAVLGLGWEARGGFMGKHHAEISGEMSLATLEDMLESLEARSSLAA